MNKLEAKIASIQSEGDLSLVQAKVFNQMITSIIIATPENTPYLREGEPIFVMFNETEVLISVKSHDDISLRNEFRCIIHQIESDSLMSRLTLNFNEITLNSVITSGSVKRLGLVVGMEVSAWVKTNEIMIARR